MNTRHLYRWFCISLVTLFVSVLYVPNDAATQSQTPAQKPDIKTAGGLTTVTFVIEPGKLTVNLPDDMRAGDTISGTVMAEPKGQTPEERKKNLSALSALAIEINEKALELFPPPPPKERESAPVQMMFYLASEHQQKVDKLITLKNKEGTEIARGWIPTPLPPMHGDVDPDSKSDIIPRPWSAGNAKPDPKVPTHPSGAVITPDPKITQPPFSFPPLGQTGRNIVVTGPFDGKGVNTDIRIGNGEDRDNMGRLDVLAESPRQAVFAAPENVIGPTKLHLTEGNSSTTGNYRNVGVKLSAPKTNLLKGEQTLLKVEVNGLEGITKDVPLQLDSKGVILMDGGNFQNLRITPPEVNQGGTYTATRAITGQQTGGFTVVATVIVNRFDVCMTDDSNRHSSILWNTFTGDYLFTNPTPPPRPGGQPSSGGTTTPGGTPPVPPGGTSLTGTGTMTMKGCVIVLSHKAPDRRVFSRLDVCNKTGDATVETTSPKAKVKITDQNIGDNSCTSK